MKINVSGYDKAFVELENYEEYPEFIYTETKQGFRIFTKRQCLNCKSIYYYIKSNSKTHFCSRSCSVSYNNKIKPKRENSGNTVCPICGKKKSHSSLLCNFCNKNKNLEKVLKTPIRMFFRDNSPSRAKYTDIRSWARKILNYSGIEKRCEICGFDAYVEVHHIKRISDFSPDSLLGEVNSLSNMLYLCPNHHILVDKGLIDISSFRITVST